MPLHDQRRAYRRGTLDDATVAADPLRTLAAWIDEARAAGEGEPTAMALATIDPGGTPAVRMVLCKAITTSGVEFYTNLQSRKARALAANPAAAATFWFAELERSVRLTGHTRLLPRDQVDRYFASRPRGSRIGAYASHQSEPIASRAQLEAQRDAADAAHPDPGPAVAPASWGGYELIADEVELWQGREDRLHDRFRYLRDGGSWHAARLQP
ncbi:MAG: pyridoxamine 5'-phosphate oxidase [Patulibacter sp.]